MTHPTTYSIDAGYTHLVHQTLTKLALLVHNRQRLPNGLLLGDVLGDYHSDVLLSMLDEAFGVKRLGSMPLVEKARVDEIVRPILEEARLHDLSPGLADMAVKTNLVDRVMHIVSTYMMDNARQTEVRPVDMGHALQALVGLQEALYAPITGAGRMR